MTATAGGASWGARAGCLLRGAALTLPGQAHATTREQDQILDVLATFEAFGVTLLSEAVRRSAGTPSAKFAPVLKAANTTEYQHLKALSRVGGKPLTQRFWIPDAVLARGDASLFAAIEKQEEVEISAYLVGVTAFTKTGSPFRARLCAEALGTEAEHRVLARFAKAQILGSAAAPNDKGFESFPHRTATAALNASRALGIGFGKRSALPGKFYTFPGDPRTHGTGSANITPAPA